MSDGDGTTTARRFLAPEVIQTSAMDCGPAALKSLLEGFGVRRSSGRPGWRGVAAVDAAARATEALVERAGIGRRRGAAFAALAASARAEGSAGLVGGDFWMARPAPDSDEEILVRGAIALRVLGRAGEP